jgi:hypothetical protein
MKLVGEWETWEEKIWRRSLQPSPSIPQQPRREYTPMVAKCVKFLTIFPHLPLPGKKIFRKNSRGRKNRIVPKPGILPYFLITPHSPKLGAGGMVKQNTWMVFFRKILHFNALRSPEINFLPIIFGND